MRRFPSAVALAAALLLAAGALPAATDLYDADVPVDAQDDATRAAAVREALDRVLVRMLGSRDAFDLRDAAEAVGNPERFLQRYGFHRDAEGQLHFTARFDAEALEQALRDARLPVWGRNRPEVLLWIDAGDGLLAEGRLDLSTSLATAAARGVPLRLPRADAAGHAYALDIARGDRNRILDATDDYLSPLVLAGQLRDNDGTWFGQWLLLDRQDLVEQWSGAGTSADAAIAAAIDELADHLGRRLAVRDGGAVQDIDVLIHSVRSLDDYLAATAIFDRNHLVERYAVLEAAGEQLLLRVRVEGSREALERSLGAARELRRSAGGQPGLLEYDIDG